MAQSLLAKVEAAQAAYARGQSDMAIQIVQSFIDEVRAQSGQHMDDDHAGHMMAHAQMVIDHLNGIR